MTFFASAIQPIHLPVIQLVLLFVLKIVVFIIGYKVVFMGKDLLEKGVKGEFKFKSSIAGVKHDLVSASPGLLFLLLGVGLIAYAIGVTKITSYKQTTSGRETNTSTITSEGPPDVPIPTTSN